MALLRLHAHVEGLVHAQRSLGRGQAGQRGVSLPGGGGGGHLRTQLMSLRLAVSPLMDREFANLQHYKCTVDTCKLTCVFIHLPGRRFSFPGGMTGVVTGM